MSDNADEGPEFIWACGLFEGEGALGCFGNGRRLGKVVTMQIVMSDLDVVQRFHSAVGGVGTIDGPYYQKAPSRKALYRWRMRGGAEAMAELLGRMWPYLGDRRREQGRPIFGRAREVKANRQGR